MAKSVNRELLEAARQARTVLFHLMLAEKAARAIGTYTAAYEKLDKAVREAEAAVKPRTARGRFSRRLVWHEGPPPDNVRPI
jgi:hypothetical protein